jgi:uncharacterized membrane protein YbhN (UPF0104 family)
MRVTWQAIDVGEQAGTGIREVVHPERRRRRALLHAVFALVGAAAIALLVRSVGVAALVAALRASARWLPLLFALEAGRAALEAFATWSLSARVRARVRLPELARAHLIAYAVSMVMPAGRAAGEATKAALLSRRVGAPEAAAVAAGNQSAALLGGALAAVPCAVAAAVLAPGSPLTWALAVFAAGSSALTAAFQLALRRGALGGSLLRRITGTEEAPAAFREALARMPAVPLGATLAAVGSRALFAVELAVLLHAAGGSALRAPLALGVSLVGGALGDLVPGQLGASDGAFALAAPLLGITRADGVALAMTLHLLQIGWAVLGGSLPLWWKVGLAGTSPQTPLVGPRPPSPAR